MSLPFIETFKGMITSPGETIRSSRSGTLGDSIIYFLLVVIIYSVLSTAIALLIGPVNPMPLSPGGDIAAAFGFIIALVIFGTISLLFAGAIIHICSKIVGGKGDYTATVRAFSLSETPMAAIGWIPFLGFLAPIWGLILMVMGIRDYHDISTIRAVIAVLLPAIVIIILAMLGLMYFMIDPTSVTVTEIPSVTV